MGNIDYNSRATAALLQALFEQKRLYDSLMEAGILEKIIAAVPQDDAGKAYFAKMLDQAYSGYIRKVRDEIYVVKKACCKESDMKDIAAVLKDCCQTSLKAVSLVSCEPMFMNFRQLSYGLEFFVLGAKSKIGALRKSDAIAPCLTLVTPYLDVASANEANAAAMKAIYLHTPEALMEYYQKRDEIYKAHRALAEEDVNAMAEAAGLAAGKGSDKIKN